jgi:tRNA-dihydrouridine synthase A
MENNCEYPNKSHRLSIAPMMAITNNHFRKIIRLLTKETLLYTEMIHHDTILNSKRGFQKELQFSVDQKPIVIQLGGNNPDLLEKISLLAKEFGYDEINLNCGCPSNKVIKSNFGACLMKEPDLVAECVKRMKNISGLESTVKCRLGLDVDDPILLKNFINR